MMQSEDWNTLRVGDLVKHQRSGIIHKITQRHDMTTMPGVSFSTYVVGKPDREYRLTQREHFEKVDTVVYSTIIDVAEGAAVEDVSAMLAINPTGHALLETLRGKRVLESLRGKRVKITMELVED